MANFWISWATEQTISVLHAIGSQCPHAAGIRFRERGPDRSRSGLGRTARVPLECVRRPAFDEQKDRPLTMIVRLTRNRMDHLPMIMEDCCCSRCRGLFFRPRREACCRRATTAAQGTMRGGPLLGLVDLPQHHRSHFTLTGSGIVEEW